jgi:hypothetical protein
VKLELIRLGSKIVRDLQGELYNQNINASNSLSKSLRAVVLERRGGITLQIRGKAYWYFVDKGRKKGKQPPTKPIEKWLRVKGLVDKWKLDKPYKVRGMAYVIARTIGLKGTKATDIFTNYLDENEPIIQEKIRQRYFEMIDGYVGQILRRERVQDFKGI